MQININNDTTLSCRGNQFEHEHTRMKTTIIPFENNPNFQSIKILLIQNSKSKFEKSFTHSI